MLSLQERKILQLLLKTEYITATELAGQLGIGVKTVRMRIKELNGALEKSGAAILSKPRYGYYIEPEKRPEIRKFLECQEEDSQRVPSTAGERTNYLLAYLLNQNDYVKADMLCDFLYISRGTLTNALKQVEEVYRKYHLSIEKKPNYGIRVKGKELDIRQCMTDIFVKGDGLDGMGRQRQTEELQNIGQIVYRCTQKYDIGFSDISYNDFVEHIYIAVRRIRQGQYAQTEQIPAMNEAKRGFVRSLTEALEAEYALTFPKEEQDYLALLLLGKSAADSRKEQDAFTDKEDRENQERDGDLEELAEQMLELVYREFQIDFRENRELRTTLAQHLMPMSIRLKYHILLRNPMLDEIRENYIFAYTIAAQAASVLKEYFQCEISEDETGELAEIFELALEQQKGGRKRYSVLIVCASGRSSSQLLKYRYQNEFKDYIDKLYTCNLYEVKAFDFSKVDYVLTTVPVSSYVPVPVLEVSSFLKDSDKIAVRKLLERESRDFLEEYYQETLFFTDIGGTDRETVLLELCRRVVKTLQTGGRLAKIQKGGCKEYERTMQSGLEERKHEFTAEELYESVLRREKLSPTDYGNLVAIPHPDNVFTEHTFVAVAVLDRPVFWAREEVQVIILTVIGDAEDPNIQKFYEATTDLLLRQDDIAELVRRKSFDCLMQLLRK
jgi:lichenan operon transcriptional antiterminator